MIEIIRTIILWVAVIVCVVVITTFVLGLGLWVVNNYGLFGYITFAGVSLFICGNLKELR